MPGKRCHDTKGNIKIFKDNDFLYIYSFTCFRICDNHWDVINELKLQF